MEQHSYGLNQVAQLREDVLWESNARCPASASMFWQMTVSTFRICPPTVVTDSSPSAHGSVAS
jgi:hypothetical protein